MQDTIMPKHLVTDGVWEIIESLLPMHPPSPEDRPKGYF
jgi:hypothetical protein